MIFGSDSAAEAVEKTITKLCEDLEDIEADDPKFVPTVDAIAKLRASQNPVIQQTNPK